MTRTESSIRKRGIKVKRGCTQCGECLNVCPVYRQFSREEYAPKGKRLLLEPLHEDFSAAHEKDPELDWEHIKELARLCAGCGKCQQACARKLSTADLLSDVRAQHPHWTQHFWSLWIKHMGPMWPSLGMLASLVPGWVAPKGLRPSLDSAKAMVNKHNLKPWVTISKGASADVDVSTPVVVFQGCTAKNIRPQWTEKAQNLLRAWGYEVKDSSGFNCCGGTMHTAGIYDTMHEMQQKNIEHWRALGRPRIAVFCASCHHALADYANSPLSGQEAEQWKQSLMPLSRLLKGAEAHSAAEKPELYGYHQPCHWKTDEDMPFLQEILPGLVKGNGICCGMGGILQITNPDLSRNMADSCMQGFPRQARNILTSCSGCTIQLTAAAPEGITVNHWLDVVTL